MTLSRGAKWLVLTAVLAGGGAGLGVPAARAAEISCKGLSGYVNDPDPKGVNVRAAPSIKARVIAVLPKVGSKDDPNGTMVEIVATRNGWLRIVKAETVDEKVTFKGSGWVHASRIATGLQPRGANTVPLYAGPSLRSRLIARMPMDDEGAFLTCKGKWVRVRVGKRTGWLAPDNQCPSPVTTCP